MIKRISFDESKDKNKKIQKLCNICENSYVQFKFSCNTITCGACIKDHFLTQIQTYNNKYLSDKIVFTCPNTCKCLISNVEVEKIMDKETLNKYNSTLTKMCLAKQGDVQNCPNSACKNAGFYDINCTKEFECNFCGSKWKNTRSLENRVLNILNYFSYENLKSMIKVFILSKSCNNCGTKIEKNKGCKHMECFRCEYSFCWRCTGDWKFHNEYACMGLFTNIYDESFKPNFLGSCLFLFGIVCLLKVIFSFTIILRILNWLLYLAVFFGLLAIECFTLFKALDFLYRREKIYIIIIMFALLYVEDSLIHNYELHPFSKIVYTISEVISLALIGLIFSFFICRRREVN